MTIIFLLLSVFTILAIIPSSASAADTVVVSPLGKSCASLGSDAGLAKIISCYSSRILTLILYIASVGTIVMIIASGYLFMTSAGNSEKVKSAQSALTAAIVGIIIVILSFSIKDYVLSRIIGGDTTSVTPAEEIFDNLKNQFKPTEATGSLPVSGGNNSNTPNSTPTCIPADQVTPNSTPVLPICDTYTPGQAQGDLPVTNSTPTCIPADQVTPGTTPNLPICGETYTPTPVQGDLPVSNSEPNYTPVNQEEQNYTPLPSI